MPKNHRTDASSRRSSTTTIAAVLLVVAAVAGLYLASERAAAPSKSQGVIARSFGTPDACQSTAIALEPKQGVDLVEKGQKIVDAYEGVPGIGDVELDPATRSMNITWCINQNSEQGVLRILSLTGLVTIGSAQTQPL